MRWLWLMTLFGCDVAPTAPDNGATDQTVDCVCDAVDACCGGCQPISTALACDAGDGVWGLCDAGACYSGGSRESWSLPEGAFGHSLAAAGDDVAVGWEDGLPGEGGGLRWWQGDALVLEEDDAPVYGVALAEDGRLAVCDAVGLRVLDAAGALLHTGDCDTGDVAFSPDGSQLAVAVTEGVVVLDDAFGVLATLDHPRSEGVRLWVVRWSAEGDKLATGSGQAGFGSPEGEARLWRTETWEAVATLGCTAMDLDFSPDGRLAAACWTGVRVFGPEGLRLKEVFTETPALSVSWSGHGALLYVGRFSGGVTRLSSQTWEPTGGMWGQGRPGSFKALRRHGHTLLGVGWDSTPLTTWTLDDPGDPQ